MCTSQHVSEESCMFNSGMADIISTQFLPNYTKQFKSKKIPYYMIDHIIFFFFYSLVDLGAVKMDLMPQKMFTTDLLNMLFIVDNETVQAKQI